MVPPKNNDFKPETYTRLTSLVKTRLANIKKAIDELNRQTEPLTLVQIKTLNGYSSAIQRKRDEFETSFQRALLISGEDAIPDETLSNDQDEIDDLFITVSGLIDSLLHNEETKANTDNSTDNASLSTAHSQVRLPKIELPKFSGNLASWTSFINLFDTTIHNNNNLSEVMKFQYLLGVLEKEPLNLVRSLNLTASNYLIAYNLLRDHYHNNRRLQLLHLNQLLDLPQMSSKNIHGVRKFVNMFNENAQALAALECEVKDSNPVLVAILLRKMDVDLRKRLEVFRAMAGSEKHTLPTIKEIIDFLNTECTQLEDASLSQITRSTEVETFNNRGKNFGKSKSYQRNVSMMATSIASQNISNNSSPTPCSICDQPSHKIYVCPTFKAKSPQERFKIVKEKQLCVSCLGNHSTKMCQSKSACKLCNKRHHTLLHFNVDVPPSGATYSNPLTKQSSQLECSSKLKPDTSVTLASHNHSTVSNANTTVVLGTLLVQVSTPCGNSHVFRALLDSGSMCNLITEHAASLLNTRRQKSDIQLSGIDQHVTNNKGQIFLNINTLSGQTIATNQPTLILDRLTVDLPRMPLSPDLLKMTLGYTLADPTFHVPSRIDIVLGGTLFPQVFNNEQISLGHNLPYMLGTHFGYVIMGTAPCIPSDSKLCSSTPATTLNVCLHSISEADLHSSIQRFWLQEEPPSCSTKTYEEEMCDKHFAETHARDVDGRYIVRLPFKTTSDVLGESKHAAELRLHAMECKFKSNDRFSQLYHEFMDEYSELGHMSECYDINLTEPHYFLPHHGVLKESSSTTKLRTVFDASCKTTSGLSLNEILLTGRKLQNNICDLLIQFRLHNFVFCCDIRQMYRQITVHSDDQQFQLILWRKHLDQPMSVYKLNTVTYGMNSSPYLAIRVLHQLADDEQKDFPDAARILRTNTYVDDIITGADTEEEAISLQNQLVSLLNRGCFELRKWVSNSPKLLSSLPDNHLESPKFLQDSNAPHFRVLGLQWSPTTDSFSYDFQPPSIDKPPTKRSVLSTIAQIYDPCGFLVPFIMLAKCFMQLLWTKGLTWDSPLPIDIRSRWQSFTDNFKWLSNISIRRSFNLYSSQNIELHGFCDASEVGYAAVTYLKCESSNGSVSINLLMAKSRVAPLKRVTIPRLELCSALLLAKLVAHIKSIFEHKLTPNNIHLWCDSTVALTWLQTPPYRLKTYVANRVAQAQELVPTTSWKHIRSEENPADCASRGLLVSHLVNHTLWWNGPSWLSSPSSDWPTSSFTPVNLDSSHEIKPDPLTVLTVTPKEEWSLLTKYSSWTTLQRTMALVLRFINNCRNPIRKHGYLTTDELLEARLKIFFLIQQTVFYDEFKLLTQERLCSKGIQKLNPFIDPNNLICVGGRLRNSSLSYDAQHPILLPKRHHVVNILIDFYHVQYLHAGPQLLQSLLSRFVWILCSRSVIRSRVHKCLTCFKHRPTNKTPLMGDLPPPRTTPSRPFSSTGIDYAGPFTIKIVNLRFAKQVKVYICLFVCMSTKAIHIEVVTDMTTEAFIAALTRFTSRRGLCSDIYSDCGTNFIGADALLRKTIHTILRTKNSNEKIQRCMSNAGIRFHFNPPASPHQGGLWESAIKSAKHHLKRVMGDTILTLPEFTTLTVRIEAMLNSRPLTPLSQDPSDLAPLTPAHFLIGTSLTSIPEYDLTDVTTNRLKRWQLTQQLFQRIWHRWSLEYLHTLQQRSKWTTSSKNLKIGDLVLMNDQSSPLNWPLSRIVEVFPGKDGIVRVAKVKSTTETFLRPVTKLFPLPTS